MIRGRLGRVKSRDDARTLRLSRYLTPGKYDAPPPARDWFGSTVFSWFLNDKIGDCACASLCHMLQAHANLHNKIINISDSDVVGMYSAVSGYDPAKPETDRGSQMIDALRYMNNTGIAGHKIGAYVQVNQNDAQELRAAMNLFGGVYVGARLPKRVLSQGNTWEVVAPSYQSNDDAVGSLGGHAFTLLRYDRLHFGLATWASRYTTSNAWISKYVDECWAIISSEWVDGTMDAPNGFDMDRLRLDLSAL